ncbi:hypothetical protein B0H17DRAFT_259840 [Mycena rosella]|uniref:Uncharacterized protein n=1 Tax=Mycena rosella TaxID=1033263 RepID=A0AAD7G8C7_MYCRO|nr:hypothetical protein B0H17DRAFT_259840 [Mycena rosella]
MAFSTTATSNAETCMSLAISCVPGPQSQSFEEVRMANYLESYRATGRPPAPCPPYPTDPAARAAQRLPPLFVPTLFTALGGPSAPAPSPFGALGAPEASTSTVTPTLTDPARLPAAHAFTQPVRAPEGEFFASIAAVPEYAHWSHDELRMYAYARGARQPPPGTPLFPFVQGPVIAGLAAPQQAALPQDNGGDQFVSISCRPEFAGHSVEELRLSFLRTGAELTSAQIFAGSTPSTNPLLAPPHNPNPLAAQNPPQIQIQTALQPRNLMFGASAPAPAPPPPPCPWVASRSAALHRSPHR